MPDGIPSDEGYMEDLKYAAFSHGMLFQPINDLCLRDRLVPMLYYARCTDVSGFGQ